MGPVLPFDTVELRDPQIRFVDDRGGIERVTFVFPCHLVFVSSAETKRLRKVLDVLEGRSVLTVGEMDRFADRGGMINFVIDEETVRFEINLEAAEGAGLKVSSQLLKVAASVNSSR